MRVCLIVLLAPQLLHTTTIDFGQLLKSLLFIPYRRESGLLQPIRYVGWTLNYEMFFYVMFSLGMVVSTRPVVVVTVMFVALTTVGYVFNPSSVLGEFCTAPIILEFVAGMWIYEFYRRRGFQPARGLSLLVPLGLGILFVQLFWPANLGREIAFGIPGALAVLGAVSWQMGTNSLTVFAVVLGNASYSLYLSHPYGINAIAALAKRFLDTSPVIIVAIVILMLAITVISALLLYKYFERPSNRWLSAKLISPKRRSTVAAEAA